MKIRNIIILLGVFILLSFTVFATSCEINEQCQFLAINTNENTTTANVTVYLSETLNETFIMSELEDSYIYNYIFTEYGAYTVCVTLYNESLISIDNLCETYDINVSEESSLNAFTFQNMFVLILFCVFAGFSLLIKNGLMGIMSSFALLFFGISLISTFLAYGIITIGFSIGLSLYFLFMNQ